MNIAAINALSAQGFVDRFGALYEHSPWIAAGAAARRPFVDLSAMAAAMAAVVEAADEAARIELLRAHPELAGSAMIEGTLTDASSQEQALAGLGRLQPMAMARFRDLNARYRARFGFPFIVCLRLADRARLVEMMAERLENDRDTEIRTALHEVNQIARTRLSDMLA